MAPRPCRSAVALALASAAALTASSAASEPPTVAAYHRYIIVGAGPGGMQLAHYLSFAKRDFVVLEKSATPGSFFEKFPRWRQLISINKPVTGRADLDFNFRHDWNSLLPEPSTSSPDFPSQFSLVPVPCLLRGSVAAPQLANGSGGVAHACFAANFTSSDPRYTYAEVAPGLQFRDYTSTYYPHADGLVDYFRFWASDAAPRGRILTSHEPAGQPPPSAPSLNIVYNTVVASVARPAAYSPAGKGGAESAARRASGAPRFRLHTSDGRVYECTYLIWAAGLQQLNHADGVNISEVAENYWTHSTDLTEYHNKSVLVLGRGNAAFEVASHILGSTEMVHVVGRDTGRIRLATETHYPGDVRRVHSNLLETYLLKSQDGLAELPQGNWGLERIPDGQPEAGKLRIVDSNVFCRKDQFGRALDRCLLGRAYDKVISCPGWHLDVRPFSEDVRPAYAKNGKHPGITPMYESVNVSGLYFAGTLGHAHDYRKSSGGFIHGFRYAARALHRILEEEELATLATVAEAGAPSPASPAPLAGVLPAAWPRRRITGLRSAASTLLRRMNAAAGIYQMFGTIADVYVLPPFPATAARNFTGAGVFAALHDPSSFPDPSVTDPALVYVPAAPHGAHGAHPGQVAQARNDAIIDSALQGSFFEELPVSLPPLKAPGWAAQTAATIGGAFTPPPDPTVFHATSTGAHGHAEWITLTLEFGGTAYDAYHSAGSGSVPLRKEPTPTLAPFATKKPMPVEDPFADDRVNSSAWNPEQSRFLHPVLRYYHSGLGSEPVLTHHLVEDFNNWWDHDLLHVLSLARFLQDVGARRAASALAMEAAQPLEPVCSRKNKVTTIIEPRGGTAAAPASPTPTPACTAPLGDAALRRLLAGAWHVRRGWSQYASALRRLSQPHFTNVHVAGVSVPGGEGWFHALSIAFMDRVLYQRANPVLSIHWRNTAPFPLTPEENATWTSLKDQFAAGTMTSLRVFAESTRLSLSTPPGMTPQAHAQQVADDALFRSWYAYLTSQELGAVILETRARTGLGEDYCVDYGGILGGMTVLHPTKGMSNVAEEHLRKEAERLMRTVKTQGAMPRLEQMQIGSVLAGIVLA